MTFRFGLSFTTILLAISSPWQSMQLSGQDIRTDDVIAARNRGIRYLVDCQQSDGSFPADGILTHPVGVTGIATLALLNTDTGPGTPAVRRALRYLRSIVSDQPSSVHEIAMLLMALAAANEPTDHARLAQLSDRLQQLQFESGGWASPLDRSTTETGLSQVAVLALRDAAHRGIEIDQLVWVKARRYWKHAQNADGSWGQTHSDATEIERNLSVVPTTFGALSVLSICQQMLAVEPQILANGEIDCCHEVEADHEMQRGMTWLQTQARSSSDMTIPDWSMIYGLIGLERAGQFSGQSFLGEQDWYRGGVTTLVSRQDFQTGYWEGNNRVVSTSHALLYLSKALVPVLINRLTNAPGHPIPIDSRSHRNWNRHCSGVGELVELLRERKGWPHFLASQEVSLTGKDLDSGLNTLRQAPVLFMSGDVTPELSVNEVTLLKTYLQQGGFLFAAPACQTVDFERGFRELVKKLMSSSDDMLVQLPPDHPLFRSECLLDHSHVKFYGVDTGCRTSIVYCPEDLACLWAAQTHRSQSNRPPQLEERIRRAGDIGANVVAYASGREPPNRFEVRQLASELPTTSHTDGRLLQIVQVRHGGAWNTIPDALSNLLKALNQTSGIGVSQQANSLALDDPRLDRYPILYMHGRSRFDLSETEIRALQRHLQRGGVLFADACCAASSFDRSFRRLATQLDSRTSLKRIPLDHELFSDRIGHDLRKVKFRSMQPPDANMTGSFTIEDIEPFLEAVEWDGRLVLIYSKYDLSCALDPRTGNHCEGYLTEDAIRIATNIVRYALLQDLRKPAAP